MTDAEMFNIIVEAIREEIESPMQPIELDMTAANIPGWDSLAHSRIVMNIEARIDREIDIDATYQAATVADLVPIIRRALAA
jgi:acyl carrier protein